MTTSKQRNAAPILWGKHPAHGDVWLKLTSGSVRTEQRQRTKEGWTTVVLPKGTHPND